MKINNAIVHHLSPERGGFSFAPWNNSVNLPSYRTRDDALVKTREALRLNSKDSDFYTVGPLQALYSYPELVNMIPDQGVDWFYPSMVKMNSATLEGGVFTTTNDKLSLCWKPQDLPDSIQVTFQYVADNAAAISTSFTSKIVPIQWFDDRAMFFGKGFQDVLAGCNFGIIPTMWEEGTIIRLNIHPSRYPYKAVADRLLSHAPTMSLINSHGLLDSFHASPDPFYKVAVVACAIVLSDIKLRK
jgi:hypothetical protein